MVKIGRYKIINEIPLIVEYYKGIIRTDDVIYLKNVLSAEPNYNQVSDTILDFRDCTLDIRIEEFPGIMDYLRSNFNTLNNRRVAYITSKPNEVVITTLYQQFLADSDMNYNPQIFSTEEAAAAFFCKELIKPKELTEIIEELRTTPNNVYSERA